MYRGITEADDGRQSYGKGHFPPLLSAHGVLTPVQVCALRTQRMLEVDGVPWPALEALVQASYYHPQQNPDARTPAGIRHQADDDAAPGSSQAGHDQCSPAGQRGHL